MATENQLPIYQKLILALRAGYMALDQEAKNQVAAFVGSQQAPNGGFFNRGGTPDFYYSLFGYWLSEALESDPLRDKLRTFIDSCDGKEPEGTVDLMALTLIRTSLSETEKKYSLRPVLRKLFKESAKIDLSYRFFLLLMILDAQNRYRRTLMFFARTWLYFYRLPDNTPCSILAALVYVKSLAGLNFNREREKLLFLYENGSGFRVFGRVMHCDLLSTAVALFVLKETGYDLRIITPGCLEFAESNFQAGAFMAGDGDQSLDLEYTFYGLIALGSLTNETYD